MNQFDHVRVNGDRLWQTHVELSKFGALPNGGCCRLSLSDEDRQARDLFSEWCIAAGCRLDVDRAGNMYATRSGEYDVPSVASGSHLDTQPHGGKFDGVFGVMAALEVIRTLNDYGIDTQSPVTAINWTNEEGVRFPIGLLGSSAYAGRWTIEELENLSSTDGVGFRDELRRIGYDGDYGLGEFEMASFYEAHIEQGPVLEREGVPIGVVATVQGLRWYQVTVVGTDQHAGTTPMDSRKDSLAVAAKMIVELEALGWKHMPDIRITVGRVEVSPNSGSTIPGETKFNVDLRHPQTSKLNFIESQIMGICQKLGKDRSVAVEVDRILEIPPVVFNESCVNDIEAAAVGLKVPYRRMISGALHDACPISSIVPTAMIFVPCQDGISHNEAENAEPEDLERGCNVLLHAILSRANPSM